MRTLAAVLLFLVAGAAGAVETQPWVKESNENAKILLESIAKFAPEFASQLGVEGYDDQVADVKPKAYERGQAAGKETVKKLQARLEKATDPAVRQDLQIMILAAQDNLHTNELQNDLVLPYQSVSRQLFGGIRTLLDPRISKERQALAVERLKRYAGLTPKTEPFAKLARDRTEEKLGNKKLLRPFKGQVEQDLNDTPTLMKGLRDLFARSGLTGWQDAMDIVDKQVAGYDEWVRTTILPQAATDHLLPPVIYADNLKQFGVTMDPHELIDRALFTFAQTRDEMQALSVGIAREHGWKSSDYRDVIRQLKQERIPNEQLLEIYRARLAAIEKIVREEKLLTLPERPAAIRLASRAESAALPAPHLNPPRLIGNAGEVGEFVLPTSNPNAESGAEMDDFNFAAITWTLTAHEARPGHELQFSKMVEHGVSTARALFAFNSANVEGWGLYSEAIMKPYFTAEAQLGVLQARLERAARAFLDPMINLGMIQPADAKRILQEDVVLSEPLAKEEVDRYTFNAPGQATAYFFGYSKLEALRAKTQLALGGKFDAQSYHDFIIAQGLLPPDLLEKAVMEYYVKPRLG